MYQSLFQLNLTQLLLDFDFCLSDLNIQGRLRRRCQNPKRPTRQELDPASLVTHATLEKWGGFQKGHPLELVSKHTLSLYKRVVESRHNLVYRPFMLDQCFWEDCTLIDLLEHLPSVNEIEQAYQDFSNAVLNWHLVEEERLKVSLGDSLVLNLRPAGYFIGV